MCLVGRRHALPPIATKTNRRPPPPVCYRAVTAGSGDVKWTRSRPALRDNPARQPHSISQFFNCFPFSPTPTLPPSPLRLVRSFIYEHIVQIRDQPSERSALNRT